MLPLLQKKFVTAPTLLFRLKGTTEMELGAAPLAPAPLKQRGDKQPSAEVLPQPVAVHVVDGHGYVWDADGERTRECGEMKFRTSFFFRPQPLALFSSLVRFFKTDTHKKNEQTRAASGRTTASSAP